MKKPLCLLLVCVALSVLLSACDLPVPTASSTPGTSESKPSGSSQQPSEAPQPTTSTQPTTPTEPKPTEPKPTESKPTESKPTTPTEPVHTCQATGQWLSDKDNHWRLCDCGNTLELTAHSFTDNACTVCGAKQAIPERPINPPADLKAHEKFDKNACAALIGTWEMSQTQSTQDMGLELEEHISVTMTVRITFTENGIQVMQMIADEEAYYQLMLVTTMESIYYKYTYDGKTRAEVDAELAQQGTSVQKMAEEQFSNRNLLPDDGYFWFYLENGMLYYGQEDSVQHGRVTVTEDTLTMHSNGDGEDTVLTRVK